MKNALLIVWLPFICMSFWACGASKSASKDSPKLPTSQTTGTSDVASKLSGKWLSSCTLNDDKQYQTSSLTFNGSTLDGVIQIYSDQTCAQELINIQLKYSYTVGATISAIPGAYEFNTKPIVATETINDASTIAEFNNLKSCGVNNWQVSVPKDITSCTDIGPKSNYGIIFVQGNTLKVGEPDDLNDGSSPEKRENKLNHLLVFQKQ